MQKFGPLKLNYKFGIKNMLWSEGENGIGWGNGGGDWVGGP